MYFQHNIWNRFSDVWTRRRKMFDNMGIDFLNIFLFAFWMTVMLLIGDISRMLVPDTNVKRYWVLVTKKVKTVTNILK